MTNQTEPKTRTIKNDRTLASLFPSRFLKPAQLIEWGITSILVTVARIQEEEVQPRPNQTEWKPVLYFYNKNGDIHPQGYLLSAKVDADALQTSTGALTIEDLIGKKIGIELSEYRGKAVLRIDAQPIEQDQPEEEEPEAFSDSAAGEEISP
jgi:hypothetical protein